MWRKSSRSVHPEGYRKVENVRWGKGGLPLRLAQGVVRSHEPRWARARSWGDRISRWWLLAGCIAAVIGVLGVQGVIGSPQPWPLLTAAPGAVVSYGTTPLQEVSTSPAAVWTGPITVAIRDNGVGFGSAGVTIASTLFEGSTKATTVCHYLTGTSATCAITISTAGVVRQYRTLDALVNGGRCWSRAVVPAVAGMPLPLIACAPSGRSLLLWALPAGVLPAPNTGLFGFLRL